jgi:hypothetical protein
LPGYLIWEIYLQREVQKQQQNQTGEDEFKIEIQGTRFMKIHQAMIKAHKK